MLLIYKHHHMFTKLSTYSVPKTKTFCPVTFSDIQSSDVFGLVQLYPHYILLQVHNLYYHIHVTYRLSISNLDMHQMFLTYFRKLYT